VPNMKDGWDDSDETTGVYDPSSSSPPSNERWFMSRDGRTKQQFTAAEIIQQCQEGTIDYSTLVWREGLPDWAPLGEVPELAQAVRAFSRPGGQPPAGATAVGQRPSLPTLPPTPSLPPRPASTTPPSSLGQRLSQRVTNLVIDERHSRPLGGGPARHRAAGQPWTLLDIDEPYSLLLPGGRRVGLWSLAVGAGVFVLCGLLGMVFFGSDDNSDEQANAEPILVDLDSPPSDAKSQGTETQKTDDGDGPSVEESTDPPLNEEDETEDSKAATADDESGADRGSKQLKSKIDREAVTRVLGAAAKEASSCKPSGKATGAGKVKVVFEPTGKVSRVSLLTPAFEKSETGGCVALAFRKVKVPPYEGGRVSAVKSFTVK